MSKNTPFSGWNAGTMMLAWDPMTGLREVPVEQLQKKDLPCGTVVRFGDIYAPWKVRVKRRISGRTWKQVSIRDLSKRLKAEAMLLNIQIEQPSWNPPPHPRSSLITSPFTFSNHRIIPTKPRTSSP